MTSQRVGVIVPVREQPGLLEAAADFGVRQVELNCWDEEMYTPGLAQTIQAEAARLGIAITALWAGWPGPRVWDFIDGPRTLGIVPPAWRQARVSALKKGADFAHHLGLPAIITHLGFIPENASDPDFPGVVAAVREVAEHLAGLGMQFWFETGQETPVTMLRLIHEVGTGNLGANLDPANLILYGKANPVDALDVFGEFVRSVHAKDGLYPTDPYRLGTEVKIGQGKVDFPRLVARLAEIGYAGPFIIEREISGEQQAIDIKAAVGYLSTLLSG
jgi:sugar phosphate isomerase/epimerase